MLFNKLWISFEIVANECRKHGGRIAIEWPNVCEYWRAKHVKQYFHDLGLNKVRINECALGLTDDGGAPIVKLWTIATDDTFKLNSETNRALERSSILFTLQ